MPLVRLDSLSAVKYDTSCQGGLNSLNANRTLHGAVGAKTGRFLDGLAVISAIVASEEPAASAALLKLSISRKIRSMNVPVPSNYPYAASVIKAVDRLFSKIRDKAYTPLIHQVSTTQTLISQVI